MSRAIKENYGGKNAPIPTPPAITRTKRINP